MNGVIHVHINLSHHIIFLIIVVFPLVPLSSVRSIVLSISGCNSVADSHRMVGWLKPTLFPDTVTAEQAKASGTSVSVPLLSVYNDSIAALVSGTHGALEGFVVISGTGMIAKGFYQGKEATAGGNGALIDSGSGYGIGIDVLRAAFASADQMGPPSVLLPAVLHFLQLERVEQITDWIYADKSWDRIARLAPLAFNYSTPASNNHTAPVGAPAYPTTLNEIDAVASKIVAHAADYLVLSIKALSKQLAIKPDEKITMYVLEMS